MQHHRVTLWRALSCALCFFLPGLMSSGRAEDSRDLTTFDGFWEKERMEGNGTASREIWHVRFASNPYREGIILSQDNVITSEMLAFLRKGCPSAKRKGDVLEFRYGWRVFWRGELLDRDRMRVTDPRQRDPESMVRGYRRIPEPEQGLRGGRESVFASFPRSWKNDSDDSVLRISFDRGEISLMGGPRRGPFPGTFPICKVFTHQGGAILTLFLPGSRPGVNLMYAGAGKILVSLLMVDWQEEDIGIFSATGP